MIMVNLAFLILNHFAGMSLNYWLSCMIDGILLFLLMQILSIWSKDDDTLSNASKSSIVGISLGIVGFEKYFLALSITGWKMIFVWIASIAMWTIPGGCTIGGLVAKHFGLIMLPTWALVIFIVLDVIGLIFLITNLITAE